MELEVRDVFLRYAEILQLDVERFKQDLDSDQVKARVESDRAKGVALGIDRTPTIYVNGHWVPAPSSLTAEGLHAAIDAALIGKIYEQPASVSPVATPEPTK
jgi:protein-disulfide isomerase